jgi:Gas vesicle synthesis protein GvpL/GvpF
MGRGERELYVYAITEPGLPRRLRILGHSLHVLPVERVQVVVERRRSPADASPEILQEQHSIVVALAGRSGALLPARFGSLVDEESLRAMVVEHQPGLVEALNLVRGRQQMTVRVFGAPAAPPPEPGPPTTGTKFLEARRARAHYVPPEAETIRDVLGGFAAAERVEPGERGLRVTVFHLVPHDRLNAYRDRASVLQSQLAPYQVTVTGPWPAFAFVPELWPGSPSA